MLLDHAFRLRAGRGQPGEVKLFRDLQNALKSLNGRFEIDEYHGGAHQVRFTGNGAHARMTARCELSDLVILAYTKSPAQARLTYLQAKFERRTLLNPCCDRFTANLEQWYLLAKRPQLIAGSATFIPPPDLLSSAILPSVGSFGFFYYDRSKTVQFFYASASFLRPLGSTRYGKLAGIHPCQSSTVRGYAECQAACNMVDFGSSLFSLEIGTPVHPVAHGSASVRNWLASNLRTLPQSSLVTDLLDVLASDAAPQADSGRRFGAKSLILLKGDAAANGPESTGSPLATNT